MISYLFYLKYISIITDKTSMTFIIKFKYLFFFTSMLKLYDFGSL